MKKLSSVMCVVGALGVVSVAAHAALGGWVRTPEQTADSESATRNPASEEDFKVRHEPLDNYFEIGRPIVFQSDVMIQKGQAGTVFAQFSNWIQCRFRHGIDPVNNRKISAGKQMRITSVQKVSTEGTRIAGTDNYSIVTSVYTYEVVIQLDRELAISCVRNELGSDDPHNSGTGGISIFHKTNTRIPEAYEIIDYFKGMVDLPVHKPRAVPWTEF